MEKFDDQIRNYSLDKIYEIQKELQQQIIAADEYYENISNSQELLEYEDTINLNNIKLSIISKYLNDLIIVSEEFFKSKDENYLHDLNEFELDNIIRLYIEKLDVASEEEYEQIFENCIELIKPLASSYKKSLEV